MPYEITYIDRVTQKKEKEVVYGDLALRLLYEKKWGALFLPLFACFSFFSKWYGAKQKKKKSRKKILPFINKFQINEKEFVKDVHSFDSFNDFFIRRLKKEARPIATEDAICFADGRYLFFEKIDDVHRFFVKGKEFCLNELLQDDTLAAKFSGGSMAIARLAPMDYHRFHFPFDCLPGEPKIINGPLYSVNPIALRKNWRYLCENKRMITLLQSEMFGLCAYIEIGATFVGTITQTFTPKKAVQKGDEKGFFSFGGSCVILLFEPNRVIFDQDLLGASNELLEIKALMGQSLGRAKSHYK
jgi:phosphatidylserine decarboxylase